MATEDDRDAAFNAFIDTLPVPEPVPEHVEQAWKSLDLEEPVVLPRMALDVLFALLIRMEGTLVVQTNLITSAMGRDPDKLDEALRAFSEGAMKQAYARSKFEELVKRFKTNLPPEDARG